MARSLFHKMREITGIREAGRIVALLAVLAIAALATVGTAFADNMTVDTDTQQLNASTNVNALVVAPGATLDLNGYSLTANSIGTGKDHLIEGRYAPCNSVTAETAGPYIVTDYTLKGTDCVEARINLLEATGSPRMLFGARTLVKPSSSTVITNAFMFSLGTANTTVNVYYGCKGGTSAYSKTSGITVNQDHIVAIDGKNRCFYTVASGSTTTNKVSDLVRTGFTATHGPFSIFGGHTLQLDGSTAIQNKTKGKLYWLKVTDNSGNLKCCFVPAKDMDDGGKAGLYDIVAKKFHAPTDGTLTAAGTSVSSDIGVDVVVGDGVRGCITNSSETASTLTVDVADGTTIDNKAVAIAGNLKFVKTGAGTFVASCTNQIYSGGTEINGGVLKCGVAGGSSPFGTGGVTVGANGTIDMNGQTGYNTTVLTMDGGTLVNSGAAVTYQNNKALKQVKLTADSTFALSNNYALAEYVGSTYRETTLDLGGHTLNVLLNGANFYIAKGFLTNGTLKASADDTSYVTFVGNANENARAVDVNFDFSSRFYPARGVTSVDDFTLSGACLFAGAGTVDVKGKFKCTTNEFCNVNLSNGATLDLSETDEAFDVASALSGKGLTFANGGAFTVYTGARTIGAGTKLVTWTVETQPSTCTFTLSCDGATPAGLELYVQSDGLYVRSTAVPAYAKLSLEGGTPTWKFYDSEGNEMSGWTGGVTDAFEVRITSYDEYAAIAGLETPVVPSKFVLFGSFELPTGDGVVDMSAGLGFEFASGFTIDVKGRSLKLPLSAMAEGLPFTVTSSVDGGKLVVDVPEGTSATNSVMSLAGLLQLVKTGGGTFTSVKAGQTFTGGTEVDGGVLQCGDSGSLHLFGGGNLVKNGSFDDGTVPPSQNSGNWSWSNVADFGNPNWTASPQECVGLSKAGTGWVNSDNNVDTYALFFRTTADGSDAYVEQVVRIDKPGTYRIKFDYMAYSGDSARRGATIRATLVRNGTTNIVSVVGNITNTKAATAEATGTVSEAGEYTLRIQQDAGFKVLASAVDDVALVCGENAEVTVKAGGTLDMNGQTGYNETLIIMDGGTLVNSGSGVNYNNLALGNVRLTANSTFALSNNYAIAANDGSSYGETFLDLGGNTLDVSLSGSGNLYLSNCFMTNGAINVSSDDNRLITFFGAPSRAVNVDLTVGDGIRFYPNVETSVSGIRNFTLNGGCYDNAAATGTVEVVGTFKCTTNIFCNVKLMDGATFDLSDETGPFNAESGSKNYKRYVTFANDSAVNVEIGDRVVKIDDKLITWATQPEGCTFNLLCNGAESENFKVAPTPDGLVVVSMAYGWPVLDRENTTFNLDGATATVNWTLTSAGGSVADVFVVSTDNQSGAVVTNATALAQGSGTTGDPVIIEDLWSTGGLRIEVIAQCGLFRDIVSTNYAATGKASTPTAPTLVPNETDRQINASGSVTLGSGTTVAWLEYGPTTSYGTKIGLTLDGEGAWTETIPYNDALWTVGKVYVRVTASNYVNGVFGKCTWQKSATANTTFDPAGRTIAVTKFDRASGVVTLAFGGGAIAAQDLVVAWGDRDYGNSVTNWPYNKRVVIGTIATDATSGSFPLPKEMLVSGTYYRFFLGDKAVAPYDEEVEWIQPAVIGAYIKTDFTPSSTDKAEFKFNMDNQTYNGDDDFKTIFVAGDGWGKTLKTAVRYDGWMSNVRAGTIRFAAKENNNVVMGFDKGADHVVKLNFGGDTSKCFTIDDKTGSALYHEYTDGSSIVTANWNTYNNAAFVGPNSSVKIWTSSDSSSKVQLYYMKWMDSSGNLKHEYVPVRKKKGDESYEYFMYDTKDRKVFRNAGTGSTSFWGGDVTCANSPVEYATVQTAVTGVRMIGPLEIASRDWEQPEEHVTLVWPAPGKAATIWVVYSDKTPGYDPGEFADPSAWKERTKLGDVAASDTTGTYQLADPLTSEHKYRSMRFILATSGSSESNLVPIVVSKAYNTLKPPITIYLR